MKRKDLATVLVRFAGVYFAYITLRKIGGLLYLTWFLSFIMDDVRNEGIELTDKVNLGTALPGAISFFITAAIAYYLLKKGNRLIEFLSQDTDQPLPSESIRSNQSEQDNPITRP